MAKGWRIFLGVAVVLLIGSLALWFFSYRLLTKSLPKTDGTLRVSGTQAAVDIYRDEYGVPHIFAQNAHDLFFAEGYVTAQDRLWQMDFNRRVASGRLSEILGRSTLESDKFLRLWGFRRIAEQIVPTLSPESLAALQAYTDGVNAFIQGNQDRLPVEFSVLHYQPEPWRVEDSVALVRLMAWKLSLSWYVDLVLNELVNKLGERKAREVFPDFPADAPTIIPPTSPRFWSATEGFLQNGQAVLDLLGSCGARLGSNSWVVSGKKTACGSPLLANDPHL
ncbi:MAG: penicillin acylase family protein, partial [Calditrichaeota bacterium]